LADEVEYHHGESSEADEYATIISRVFTDEIGKVGPVQYESLADQWVQTELDL
jgi:hypothetical protein